MREALLYLLPISAAEIITITLGPMWGIASHILLLVTVTLHAALFDRDQNVQRLLLSLAIIPLIRIISLSIPLVDIPQVWWYPIIYVPLLLATMQVTRILGYRFGQIGLNFRRWRFQLLVALSGLVIGMVEYFILSGEAEATSLVLGKTWLLSAFMLLVYTGFVEEFIFRGVLQRSAGDVFGSWRGIVYVSFLFAIVHVIHYSVLDIIFVFVVAVFFGWVVKKTGSLLGVTLSHGLANIALFLVVPYLF